MLYSKFSKYNFNTKNNENVLSLTVEVPADKDYGEKREITLPFKNGKVLLEDDIKKLITSMGGGTGGVSEDELRKIIEKLLEDYVSSTKDDTVEGKIVFNVVPVSQDDVIMQNDNEFINLKTLKDALGNLPTGGGSGGSVRYSNSKPTPFAVGGIKKGSTFQNMTMEQMWNKLLYPYVSPAINSLDTTKKTYLIGESTGDTITISWSTSEHDSIKADTMKLTLDNQILANGNIPKNGNQRFTITPIRLDNQGTKSITLSFKDIQNNNISRRVDITWLNTLYYGCSSKQQIDANDVTSFTKKNVNSFPADYNFPAGGYKYLVYPASWPDIKKAINPQSSFDVPYEKVSNITITSGTGISQVYKVYRTFNVLNGSYTIRYS